MNIIRFPMNVIPQVVSGLVNTRIALKRLVKFLNSEELSIDSTQHLPKLGEDGVAIKMKDAIFAWGDTKILKNISFECQAGSLLMVVGPVGSGNLISYFHGPNSNFFLLFKARALF